MSEVSNIKIPPCRALVRFSHIFSSLRRAIRSQPWQRWPLPHPRCWAWRSRVPVRPVRLNASWQVCLWNSCVLFVPAPLPCPCWQRSPLWGWRALLCFASLVGASVGPRRGLSHTHTRTHLWLILQRQLVDLPAHYLHFCFPLMSFCVCTCTLCHRV